MTLQLLPYLKKKRMIPFKMIGTGLVIGILICFHRLFFEPSRLSNVPVVVPLEDHRTAVFIFLILLTLLSGLDGLRSSYSRFRTQKKTGFSGIGSLLIWIVLTAANSALSFFEIELINNYYLYRMETRYVVLGIAITFVLYLIIIFLTDSMSIGLVIGNCFFLAWGMVNFYVQEFRGIPLQWIDFGSFRTAASVSGNYSYEPTWQIIACLVLTCGISGFYLHARSYHNFRGWIGRAASRAIAVILFVAFASVTVHSDFLEQQGIWLRDWQPWYTYRLFGMESGFLAFAKASYPEAPETYSKQHVRKIIDDTERQEAGSGGDQPENIICIMNESFADLSIYPHFKTTTKMLPYLNSLKDNAQQGRLMVSVKGGTTANTEYEFLTGNSTVLSPNTVVYNSFIKQDQYSLARSLKDQGYTPYAYHPYYRNGWNRETVYPRMGFDRFFSLEDSFKGSSYLRGFVSDESDYDQLIRAVEGKKKGEKLFLFNVTMQNHSPYDDPFLKSEVHIPDYHGVDQKKAEQYLTLTNLSDQALKKLIDYFSRSDEKTLICFWGDHQPEIGDDFWSYCLGKRLDDASFVDQQLTYETRYLIWANYDIPEKENQTLSANYLSGYLMQVAGLKTTGYQDFLIDQRKTIPAMNAYGYLGQDGQQHEWGTADAGEQESRELEAYKCLIYHELTAGKERDESFFGIES